MKPILKIEYKDSGCSFDYFCYVNLKNFPTFSKITLTLKTFLKSVFNVSFSSIYLLIWGKKACCRWRNYSQMFDNDHKFDLGL